MEGYFWIYPVGVAVSFMLLIYHEKRYNMHKDWNRIPYSEWLEDIIFALFSWLTAIAMLIALISKRISERKNNT